ncbi:MAG: Rrf2 family transcriptional regulator [Candidatus Zixiibacteriota bacterium]|nr:MAG: Rrf2 family transcriptional regulator [candidate division Zixibacteria bacterium]
MQFTKAEEYGVLGVIYLAEQGDNRIIPLSEVAESQGVPEKFLAKIFQNLTKASIVRSHRGIKGGFSLGKNPVKVTAREVIEAIQGPYNLIRCIGDPASCVKHPTCPVRFIIELAERSLLEVFEKYTIADLIGWKQEQLAS